LSASSGERGSRRRVRWSSVRSALLHRPTSSPAQAWRRGAGIPTARGVDLASSCFGEQPISPYLRFLDGLRRMFQLPWVQACSQSDPKLSHFSRPLRRCLRRRRIGTGWYRRYCWDSNSLHSFDCSQATE
jgi:hypothetical protein